MPFTMTHLCIAEKISVYLSGYIENLPQFYLGNTAPDAVHNRANYDSDYKKASHLCVGPEKWGMVTNNDEWKDNIIKFLNSYKRTENYDFVLGYCCHILADLYNNISVWTPFRLRYFGDTEKRSLYHKESNAVDIELALTHDSKDIFLSNIRQSKSIGLADIVYAQEIEKQKEYILNIWYNNNERQDLSKHEVVTIASTVEFIEKASGFVFSILEYVQNLPPNGGKNAHK